MTVYDYVCICLIMYDYERHCMTLYNSILLYITIKQLKLLYISILIVRHIFRHIVDIDISIFKHQRLTYIGGIKASPSHTCNFKINKSLAEKGKLAHRLQCRTACKIQNGRRGAPKWTTGSWKVSTPKQLLLNKFFDPSTPSMRKGNSGERRRKRRMEKKRLMRIVATMSLPAVNRPLVPNSS